jgi:hypothetical protein
MCRTAVSLLADRTPTFRALLIGTDIPPSMDGAGFVDKDIDLRTGFRSTLPVGVEARNP